MAIILGETGRNDVCLRLGKQGEHDVTFFEFDFSLWAAKYGDGVLSLRLTPNGSATAYPVTLDFDGTIATFTVTATDTATAGLGSAELVYIVGDDEKLKKSVTYVTNVEPSEDTGEAPEPYDEWLAHLEVLAGETSQAKTDAEQAASEAKASEQAAATSEQNAKTSEDNAEEYADRIANLTVSAHEATGETPTVIKTIVNDAYNLDFGLVPGKDGKDGQDGADGVGIASVALNSDYTLTITLTDGATYTTASIRGEQGETGLTPDFTIGTVTTLAPGSQATATITGTDEEPVLNLGIPKGDPGDVSSTGYYPDLYAGGLVTDKGETDTEPYTFRASKALGYRESLDAVVGGTVAWNQLAKELNSTNFRGNSPVSTVAFNNGVMTITAVSANRNVYGRAVDAMNALSGHKYLFNADVKPSINTAMTRVGFTSISGIGKSLTANTWANISGILNVSETASTTIVVYLDFSSTVTMQANDTCDVKNLTCTDLTAMFGSTIADYIYSLEQATAGAGVAWFKKLFPKPYYAYNAGELMSVQASSHNMVGFNAFDGEVDLGGCWTEAGTYRVIGGGYMGAPNKIKCLPNTTYCFTASNITAQGFLYYAAFDANGNYISRQYGTAIPADTKYGTFTTPSDCYFIGWYLWRSTAFTNAEAEGICINLSWDGERDGEYEPYVKHSYPLDSSLTLRGIPKLDASNNLYYDGDTYKSDGTVTRKYRIVDLGTLNWIYDGDEIFRVSKTRMKFMGNGICAKYTWVQVASWSQIGEGEMSVTNSAESPILRIHDSTAGTDATAFKSAMSGVYLVYELATPTTETADPYTQIQVVDDFGTEEFVDAGSRDVAIPVGHSTFYPEDLKGKLEDIPDIPEAPASNGTYTLKAVRSNSGVTYSWVSG